MDNADFRKLLVSSSSGGDAGQDDEEGTRGGGGGPSFRRKKRAAPTELIAKGAGGRVDRNHLKEALEKEEKLKAMQQRQRGAARGGGYDDEDEDEEEGGASSRRAGAGGECEEDDETAGASGGAKGGKKSGAPHLSSSASGGLDDGAYRDRAEERRKGINPDYEDEIARLVHMDAEKTKYLGGDVKHTHLVKGLDYALLQKVKAEMDAKKEEEEREREEEAAGGGGARGGGGAAAEARARQRKTMEAVSTRTLLAKSLKTFWAQQYSDEIKPVDMFKTSALEYTLGSVDDLEGETAAPLPTLISRSKVEVEMEQESPLMLYRVPAGLMGRLTKAFVTYRQVAAGLKKKVKKRHRAEEEYGSTGGNTREGLMGRGGGGLTAKPKVEIGDIFGDSGGGGGGGEGVGEPVKTEAGKKKAVLQDLGWDKEKEEEEDGKTAAAAAAIDMDVAKILGDAGLGGGKKKEEEEVPELFAGSKGKKRQKGGESLAGAGAYDEYFPSTYGGGDSDDEERGGKRGNEEERGGGGERRGKPKK